MIFLLITHPSCLAHLRINEFVMFHIQRGFFSPLKRPPNHKHSNVTAECKPLDHMFVDESCNPSFAQEHITQENMLLFFCRGTALCWLLVLQQQFLCWHRSFVDIYWLLSLLRSHNTKTTTWLDPRLAKKAKPPEKCEDGGM